MEERIIELSVDNRSEVIKLRLTLKRWRLHQNS